MADIREWVAMGRPKIRKWSQARGYTYMLPQSRSKTSWKCSTQHERAQPDAVREEWYSLKPGCRGNFRATTGLRYSASAGGFIGEGTKAPQDATLIVPRPTPPRPTARTTVTQATIPSVVPSRSVAAQQIQPETSTMPGLGLRKSRSVLNTGLAYIPGGGLVQGGIDIATGIGDIFGIGKSKCKGPFNYDKRTGTCVPKSGFSPGTGGVGTKPTGGGGPTVYEPKPGTSPHVTTPAEYGMTGTWETGIDDRGNLYAQPTVEHRVHKTCPPGTVLDRNGFCYRKGTPGLVRKWKPARKPYISAHEAKVLTKYASVKERAKKHAQNAGLYVANRKPTCRKK